MMKATSLIRCRMGSYARPRLLASIAVAHSSWFRLEDQGMKEFEVLARGSGFLVHGPSTGVPIAVVSAHVAAPHRFRAYFPHEWLQHVQDADCRSLIETRKSDQTSESISCNLASGFRHASLDVAAFLLDDESQDRLGDVKVLSLGNDPEVDEGVEITGFRLIGESGSGTEKVMETTLEGTVREVMGSRGFVNTAEAESEMGMCGGPVVKDGKCVGILEGLVPRSEQGSNPDERHVRLSGCSVYVSGKELQMFLHDVETEASRQTKSNGKEKDGS